jgi:UDP-GlcNAc:undecaprenyl-phosphate GlcNAc-1-phosphate transferase
LGGIAIFSSFIAVVGLMLGTGLFPSLESSITVRSLSCVLGAGSLIFLVGVYDDFRPVKPYIKFSVQVVGGVILYLGGFKILHLPVLFGWHDFGYWFGLPLTVLWILLITNAFNLIDGLDGLAAGSSLFSTLAVFVVALSNGNVLVAFLSLILAGTIAGFLKFNFNPATIFLGDSGSLFIGFMLGALALVGSQKSTTIVAVAIPVVSFGLPLLETMLSVFRRFLSGQPLFRADREHIHHKLLDRGFSQRQAVIVLYGVSAVFGFLSLFLLVPGSGTVGLVLLVLGIGVWIGVQQLGYHEILELKRIARRTMAQKPLVANNLALRRATERLSKVERFPELSALLKDTFEMSDFAGFELRVYSNDSHEGGAKERQFMWHKSVEAALHCEPPGGTWTLCFDLTTSDNVDNGSFKLHRQCNDRQVMADINLLTLDFREALSQAVDRLMRLEESQLWGEAAANRVPIDVDDAHRDGNLMVHV